MCVLCEGRVEEACILRGCRKGLRARCCPAEACKRLRMEHGTALLSARMAQLGMGPRGKSACKLDEAVSRCKGHEEIYGAKLHQS